MDAPKEVTVLVDSLPRGPRSIAIDPSGDVIIGLWRSVYKFANNVLTKLAGGESEGHKDGIGGAAEFNGVTGVAIGPDGSIIVTDYGNHCIRRITSEGQVTTIAGKPRQIGCNDGQGAAARFHHPAGVVVDREGNAFVTDCFNHFNHHVRKITSGGVVTTVAGSSARGFADGRGANAKLKRPSGIAIDSEGNLFVSDRSNNRVRKVAQDGIVTTTAGSSSEGHADGLGAEASFTRITGGIAVDSANDLFVCDQQTPNEFRVRQIKPSGVVTTIQTTSVLKCTTNFTIGIAVDKKSGNLLVCDGKNKRILCIKAVAARSEPEAIEAEQQGGSASETPSETGEGRALLMSSFEPMASVLEQEIRELRSAPLDQLQLRISSAESKAVELTGKSQELVKEIRGLATENRELRQLTTREVTDLTTDAEGGTTTTEPSSVAAALARKRSREEAEAGSSSAVQEMVSMHKNAKVKMEAAAAGKEEAEVELDRIQKCVICFDDERQVVFLPCSHFLACENCADLLRECPNCREPIVQRQRLYS